MCEILNFFTDNNNIHERNSFMNRFELTQLKDNAHIHFIGIGGISMSGLAMVLIKNGYKVTGSDRQKTHITDKLEANGAVIYEGHNAENVIGADLVVHTAAVHDDNPEICKAKEDNIRLIDRAECLGAIMKLYKNAVGISGTHGKTTTTGMLTHALIYADTDPTISIGGELDIINGNIRTGKSEYFVTEACEYTNSFLKFFPHIAVITNIEEDHLDFFTGIEHIRESFAAFAELTKDGGYVVANGDDENVKIALEKTDCNIIYYGVSDICEYKYDNLLFKNGYPEFDVLHNKEKIAHIKLNVPGMHNVMNTLAVVATCRLLGLDTEKITKGIETFKGTHRRFEKLGTLNGATIIADYAHHPTEIIATLKAAKDFDYNRMWCVFQPHTYTRTKALWNDFLTCFEDCDKLVLTHIYAARETFDGVTKSSTLAAEIKQRGKDTVYIEDFSQVCEHLKENVSENDMVFIMGAGDVIEIGYEIVKK